MSLEGAALHFDQSAKQLIAHMTIIYDEQWAQPECDIFNRGSSYLNVARTTVLHLFCRMTNH